MKFITFILSLIFIWSCSNSKTQFIQLNEGIGYLVHHSNDSGETIKVGDEVIVNMIHKIGDSILINTYDKEMPIKILVSEPTSEGDLMNAFLVLKEHDSCTIKLDADFYFSESHFKKPDFLKEGQQLEYVLRIDKVKTLSLNKPIETNTEIATEIKERLLLDIGLIQQYVADNQVNGSFTKSKLFYNIYKSNTGKFLKNGQEIAVHYTGRLLDGTTFDSSYERGQPIRFSLGSNKVIPGWEEGISKMKIGEKALFIIPSYLAYGIKGHGNMIPPNSVLIFDVEILKPN